MKVFASYNDSYRNMYINKSIFVYVF